MDDYANYMGYSPYAPVMAGGYSFADAAQPATPSGAALPNPVAVAGPASFGASANFAVAGWLAAIIVGLAAYRYLWEKAG